MMETVALSSQLKRKFEHLWYLVGNTPMLEITYMDRGRENKIYAKCEHYNLTGSIKDRMALYIIQKAYECGTLKEGDTLAEATSGNTGIAFAAIGRALGHPVVIYMPNWLSKERLDIITSLGAEVRQVSKEEGGFLGSIDRCETLAKEHLNHFLPRQFDNADNARAHEETTGPEILSQLAMIGLKPDYFVAGVGTGGTVMGVGNYLRSNLPGVKIHPLEPAESPTLSTGYKVGSHRIQGISDEFIPSLVKLDQLDEIIQVCDGDAILMAQKLARELGLAVGISSGANIVGAIKLKRNLPADAVVVTVLSDSNKKYLSTDLMKEELICDGYITPEITLKDYDPISRKCGAVE